MDDDILCHRPLTHAEARKVLDNLGIQNAAVIQTYISGFPGTGYDPVGPCQVIAAIVRAETEDGETRDAEVHFCLRHTGLGWEIVAARRAWTP